MKICILAVGKIRGAAAELCTEYTKRLSYDVQVKEIATSTQDTECATLLAALPKKSLVIALDETGKQFSSRDFAKKFSGWLQTAPGAISFVIGGADGLNDAVRQRADALLSLGTMTWPHKLVRVMLLEQLYRAETIRSGHPYHRD